MEALDLRVLAERTGKLSAFEAQLRALRQRHAYKQALSRRLREKGLGARRGSDHAQQEKKYRQRA